MVWLALSLRRKMLPLGFLFLALPLSISAQSPGTSNHPWMNRSLSSDQRASLVLKEMTLDEKISMLHGTGMKDLSPISPLAVHSNGGAGYVVGVPRLGIPDIQMSDAAYGVRNSFGLAFDPVSGQLCDEQNGDDSFDELNRVEPGANLGWIQIMGPVARLAQFKQIETTFGAKALQ